MAIDDAAGFAAALTALRAHVALTIREVSRRTGIPSATLGGYFSGRHLPPPTQPAQLAELLTALGVPESRHEEWRAALNRVRRIPGPRTPGTVVPYRGLEPYGVRDAAWFVGREEVVDELHHQVGGLFEQQTGSRIVTLVGASGTGKSSLLRAGVMARLAMEGVTPVILAPGEDPSGSLSSALARFRPDTRKRLVVVDQLEEVFAEAVRPIVREAFLSSLVDLSEQPSTVVVTAIRADFYGQAVEDATLRTMLRRQQVLVEPMDAASLRRVVVEPARRAGATVEPELVDLVLRDLSPRSSAPEASSLPMLSHALLATWKHARNSRLGVSDYVAVGGVAASVQRTAESIYESLDEEARTAARRLFSQLVDIDGDGVPTRRRLATADLEDRPAVRRAVDAFAAGRILTSTEQTLELSHEVLLSIWPRLSEWLAADRDALRLRRRISLAARTWDAGEREPDQLLTGPLLELARPLLDDRESGLSALERTFVAESIEHVTDDERERRRRDVGLRAVFAVVAVLALVASGFAVYLAGALDDAREGRSEVESARDQALSRQVADSADELRASSPSLAMQLALTAYDLAPTVEARSRLLGLTGGTLVSRLVGPEGSVRAVARPDGLVATVHSDGVVRFWSGTGDAAPALIADLAAAEGGPLYAAAFSPDGQLFATAGSAGVVTVVDVRDPEAPVAWADPLTGPGATVQDLAFSPDGRILYAATSDPALARWSLRKGEQAEPLRTVTRFAGAVKSVATSSTGLVATGSADGTVRVWEARPRGLVPSLKLTVGTAANAVHSVAFSPDGRLLAAGSRDGLVRVWGAGSGRLVTDRLGGFDTWINAVAFSPDGLSLAAGAFGGKLGVWRTGTWELQRDLSAPTTFSSVQFAASADRLVTGTIDGATRVYRLDGPELPPFGGDVQGLATPADGDPVYVGVGAGAAQVVAVDLTDPLSPVVGDPLQVPAVVGTLEGTVAVTPDGSTVAAGTDSGQVVVWTVDEESGAAEPIAVLEAATRPIRSIAFSADGTTMAAAATDGRTRVYEMQGDLAPRLLHVLGTDSAAMSVSIGADASLVAVGAADGLVHLWTLDGSSAQETATLDLGEVVDAVAFAPDGPTLAAGGVDGALRLWDVTSPAAPRPLGRPVTGAQGSVLGLAYDAEGAQLAAAGADGTVSLWTLDEDGVALYARLTGLDGGVHQVLYHPSGRVVGAGAGGQMTSWVSDVDAAEELICRTAGTPVSSEEWELDVPGVPYAPPCV